MLEMRSFLLTAASFVLSGVVLGNAYYQKKQFYPSVVYITKSNPSMAVIYIQAFVFVILMGKLLRKVFFGQLRAAEMEHLIEKSWYAVTETCLAFTVFRDDFSPRFVALFTFLLFLKCFHWLAEDRVDYMERSPAISFLFHARVLSLLAFLGFLDLYFINHAYYSTLLKGASVQLVFGFEYAILLTAVFMTLVKYILHSLDLQSEAPWENKAVYLLYTELIMGFFKVMLYIAFMVIMIKVHTFPLFAIRPMYLSIRAFKKALHDVIMSRRAIRNLNTLYPDATPEELAASDVCIICREEMTAGCKKLPCNHIFHSNCLRSWFQRQQTCPTCRMDILRMSRPAAATPIQPAQPAQQPHQPLPNFNAMFQGFPPMQMWMPQPPQPPGAPHGATTAAATSTTTSTTTAPSPSAANPTATQPQPSSALPTGAGFNPFMPMSPPFSPYTAGFMPPSGPLTGLTVEELSAMEGQERENVEARIQWLRDIQILLDGAMTLVQQYNTVAAQISMAGIHIPPPTATSNAAAPPPPAEVTANTKPSTEVNSTVPPSHTSPKTTIEKKPSSNNVHTDNKKDEELDFSNLEGATGYSPPKVELIPEWNDPNEDMRLDELKEIRKRRLQKFSQDNSKKETTAAAQTDNLDLD